MVKFGETFQITINEPSNYTHMIVDFDNGTILNISNPYLNCILSILFQIILRICFIRFFFLETIKGQQMNFIQNQIQSTRILD